MVPVNTFNFFGPHMYKKNASLSSAMGFHLPSPQPWPTAVLANMSQKCPA